MPRTAVRCAALLGLALAARPATAPASPAAGGGDTLRAPGALLAARLTAARREVVLQEVFEFTLAVCSRGVTLGREIALRNEETPGLAFLPYVDAGGGRAVIDGRPCEARRFLGRAQAVATGTFGLQPLVTASVVVPAAGGGGPAGAPSGRAEVREVELRPTPLAVTVRPLPEAGRPEGFTGAVGSFAFSAALGRGAAVAGEPVTLTMEIRGRGNVESVAPPPVTAGDRFLVREPRLLRREISADRSEGRLVFEQAVVPLSAASTSLPAVAFSYFDPAAGAYRTRVAGPFPLQVRPAGPRAAVPEPPADRSEAGRPAPGAEIAPPKGEPRGWPRAPVRPWHRAPWFLVLQFLPPLILAALFLAVRRREELAKDVAQARRQLAPDAARTPLGAAARALAQGDPARFHEALWEALSSYLGHRLNLLPGQVSREVVTERLSRAGLDARDVARLGEIFQLSERERFGRPRSGAERLSPEERRRLAGVLEELGRILAACEEAPR